jgi:hypothetical protein
MKTGAVGLHHLRAESRRKGLDPREGGRGQSGRYGNGHTCKQRSAQQPKTSDSCDRTHTVPSTLTEEKFADEDTSEAHLQEGIKCGLLIQLL